VAEARRAGPQRVRPGAAAAAPAFCPLAAPGSDGQCTHGGRRGAASACWRSRSRLWRLPPPTPPERSWRRFAPPEGPPWGARRPGVRAALHFHPGVADEIEHRNPGTGARKRWSRSTCRSGRSP
jgi:hypothetical protein